MARLDRLAGAKEVAQIGAVIGREFGYELLAAVSPLGEAELREALDQLVASELVFVRGAPPAATYTFKHALVQDAAYASLLKSRRQQLHARIARELEGRWPEVRDSRPELLAHHFAGAGVPDKAAAYGLDAGRAAFRRSAVAEAAVHLQRALGQLAQAAGGRRPPPAGAGPPDRARARPDRGERLRRSRGRRGLRPCSRARQGGGHRPAAIDAVRDRRVPLSCARRAGRRCGLAGTSCVSAVTATTRRPTSRASGGSAAPSSSWAVSSRPSGTSRGGWPASPRRRSPCGSRPSPSSPIPRSSPTCSPTCCCSAIPTAPGPGAPRRSS